MAELSHEPSAQFPRRCWAEIDVSAIRHNARVAQATRGSEAPGVMAIVKADAYGHGAIAVGRALEHETCVRAFGVASAKEAMELRAGAISRPIYLLGPALPDETGIIVEHGFIAAVSTVDEARQFSRAAGASENGKIAMLHLVIDTGMGRIGAAPGNAVSFAKEAASLPRVEIDSIASHLPCADEDAAFTGRQIASYRELMARVRSAGVTVSWSHIANSAGAMGYDAAAGEMARAGLMLYGCAPIPEYQDQLRPALTLKARVSLVRDMPAGHGISYGRAFITQRPTIAATVTLGYADGYPRHLSNNGADVLIAGRRCPLLGRVTMDQIVVDATDLPTRPEPGAEVVALGTQGAESVSAMELAEKAGTIPWEIFTGISHRVERVFRR